MELDPLAAVRADIERYVRWLQDVRRYQTSTISRRLSVVVLQHPTHASNLGAEASSTGQRRDSEAIVGGVIGSVSARET